MAVSRVQAARRRRGPHRGRDRHLEGQGRRHRQGQRHRRRDRDRQVAGRAARRRTPARSPALLVPEGETVDVGTPIIAIERRAPRRSAAPAPRAAEAPPPGRREGGAADGDRGRHDRRRRPGGARASRWSATARGRPRPSAARAGRGQPPTAAGGRPARPQVRRPGRAGRRRRRAADARARRPPPPRRRRPPGGGRALAKPPVRKLRQGPRRRPGRRDRRPARTASITREDVDRARGGRRGRRPVRPLRGDVPAAAARPAGERETRDPDQGRPQDDRAGDGGLGVHRPARHRVHHRRRHPHDGARRAAQARDREFRDVKVSPLLVVAKALLLAIRRNPGDQRDLGRGGPGDRGQELRQPRASPPRPRAA